MSARTQRRQQNRRNRKPQTTARPSHLWRYVVAVAFLLLSAFGALAASNQATQVLAKVTAKLSAPAKAVAPAATPAAAPLTVAAYVAPQANNPAPPSSSPSAPPASSPSGGGDWILAPDALPPTPPTGDVPPLPVAHSAQDPGFHPVKVQHMDCVGDRIILTCLNPDTGSTETITGKQGRDTVFTLKNPEAADLPTSQIKDVEPGNLVATRNPQTGKTEFGRVVRTIKRQADALVTVRLADSKTGQAASSLTCTPEHPYFVQGQGWVEAGSLGIGSSIVTRAGPPLVVKGVDWQRAKDGTKPFTVYNFEVAGDHTYFVGKDNGGAWVHNNCYTTLYRAVSPSEASDIAETGMFRGGGLDQMTGKWFAESAEDAAKWGQRFYGDDPYNIVSARFRTSTADQMFRMDRLDNIGPARYADPIHLGGSGLRGITILP